MLGFVGFWCRGFGGGGLCECWVGCGCGVVLFILCLWVGFIWMYLVRLLNICFVIDMVLEKFFLFCFLMIFLLE